MSGRVATTQWSQVLAARDLTQGFFAEFLDKDFLSSVDPDKGRFRSFLLASLRHFLSHERDRERALKRGGGTTTLSLDLTTGEENYRLQVSEEMTPKYRQVLLTFPMRSACSRTRFFR